MSDEIAAEEGTGNIFADLGLPDAKERLAKAELASRVAGAIRSRRLTQTAFAVLFKIDQPKVSRLLRGQVAGFSPSG